MPAFKNLRHKTNSSHKKLVNLVLYHFPKNSYFEYFLNETHGLEAFLLYRCETDLPI